MTLQQLSKGLANRTGGRGMRPTTFSSQIPDCHSQAFRTLGGTLMAVTAEVFAEGMFWIVGIGEPMWVMT